VTEQPFIDWEWVTSHGGFIGHQLWQHLTLTFIAVGIGLLISLPLAIVSRRYRHLYAPITWVTGLMYTIPSLALFALLTPFTGLSTLTAEIGLVSYTLLILIRNIVAGIDAVPEDAREAALGMGFTARQMLWRVELPLALPVIVAGIRIAAVTTIGLVTVTVFVGKGGLGYLMLAGFRRLLPRPTAIVVGVALSVLLAVTIDWLLIRGQRLVSPWARPRSAGATG
jgi:osmoprotectant transport system permease protein